MMETSGHSNPINSHNMSFSPLRFFQKKKRVKRCVRRYQQAKPTNTIKRKGRFGKQ